MDLETLQIADGIELAYVGPHIDSGPLPALIYFSLSKEESLLLDPFNQPVTFLPLDRMRVFSLTIPGHGPDLDPKNAIRFWADHVRQGQDPLTPFFEQCAQAIAYLDEQLITTTLALAGLSRGAFVACHVAALCPQVKTILGYAPLTKLFRAEEFSDLREDPLVKRLDLNHLIESLSEREIRFYIGNRDRRVGTDEAFSLLTTLAEAAYEKRIRSAPFEMVMTPSIGYMGHGTSPETFKEGTEWIKSKLGL